MTPHEIAVFIEERKWDYRCELFSSFYTQCITHWCFLSIRFCSGTSGRHSHRRIDFYYFQSGGCSNVGTRQVFISFMISKCYWQPSQTSRKSNILSLLNGARVGKSTKVLQRRIKFEKVRELFYHEFETKIESHEGTWTGCNIYYVLHLDS